MSSYSRQQLEAYLQTIDVKDVNVLDIGNSQQDLKRRLKVFEPKKYVGLDLETPHEGEQSDIITDMNYPIEFI